MMHLTVYPWDTKLSKPMDLCGNLIEDTSKTVPHYHFFRVFFDTYTLNEETGRDDFVAEIIFTVFDKDICLKDNIHPTEAIVAMDEEESVAFSTLFKSKALNENDDATLLETCYLNRFYIHPNYRNKGVGTFLVHNLLDMLESHFYRDFKAVVTLPYPLAIRELPLSKDAWKEMDTKLKRCLVNAGFEEFDDKKHYIKKFDYDKDLVYDSDQYKLSYSY